MRDPGETVYYGLWTTAWGPMAAVAGKALRRIVLPHYQMKDLAELLAWEHPGAVRDRRPFERLVELTHEYFNGRHVDFGEIDCDLPPARTLSGKVLRACRSIRYGQTESYGQLARRIGRPEAARAVAAALSRNHVPLVIPCHRVTYSDGRPGGFSAPGGLELKQRMLAMERSAGPGH